MVSKIPDVYEEMMNGLRKGVPKVSTAVGKMAEF